MRLIEFNANVIIIRTNNGKTLTLQDDSEQLYIFTELIGYGELLPQNKDTRIYFPYNKVSHKKEEVEK